MSPRSKAPAVLFERHTHAKLRDRGTCNTNVAIPSTIGSRTHNSRATIPSTTNNKTRRSKAAIPSTTSNRTRHIRMTDNNMETNNNNIAANNTTNSRNNPDYNTIYIEKASNLGAHYVKAKGNAGAEKEQRLW